jgi:molybdate transport repressor ModE-like protein
MDERHLPSPGSGLAEGLPFTGRARVERLKIRHLRLLDMIARCGSLSAAAQALGISQPGATKLLHELEDALGLPLVERAARGGQLGEVGRQVLDRLRVALGAVDAATAALEVAPELPLVRVGLLPLVGIEALTRVVVRLTQQGRLPRLALQLGTVESLVHLLREGEIDCAISVLGGDVTPEWLRHMDITPLWQQSTVMVAASDHPLARRREVKLPELLDADWVLMPKPSASRKAFDRLFLAAGLAPPVARIESESFHIAMDLVAQTRMLAVVPIGAYRQQQASLRRVRLRPEFQPSAIVMLTPKGSAAELPTVALLREAFQAVAPALV